MNTSPTLTIAPTTSATIFGLLPPVSIENIAESAAMIANMLNRPDQKLLNTLVSKSKIRPTIIGNAAPTLTAVNYTLNGLPTTGRTLLLQGASAHYLCVYNMAQFWDWRNGNAAGGIPVTPASSTLSLTATGKTVTWFSPMDGTTAITSPVLSKKPLVARIA